jgi:hypothetical protein
MSHLRLVPPLPADTADDAAGGRPWAADPAAARQLFQAASGLCLCTGCAKRRHPAYGAR